MLMWDVIVSRSEMQVPRASRLLYKRAEVEFTAARYDECEETLATLFDYFPDDRRAWVLRSELAKIQGQQQWLEVAAAFLESNP
jgi:predicted Zn-dependent protease